MWSQRSGHEDVQVSRVSRSVQGQRREARAFCSRRRKCCSAHAVDDLPMRSDLADIAFADRIARRFIKEVSQLLEQHVPRGRACRGFRSEASPCSCPNSLLLELIVGSPQMHASPVWFTTQGWPCCKDDLLENRLLHIPCEFTNKARQSCPDLASAPRTTKTLTRTGHTTWSKGALHPLRIKHSLQR